MCYVTLDVLIMECIYSIITLSDLIFNRSCALQYIAYVKFIKEDLKVWGFGGPFDGLCDTRCPNTGMYL